MFFLVVWHQESLVLVPLPISVVMQIIPHEQNPQHLREMAGSGFLMFIVPLVSQRKGTRFKIATYILRLSEAKKHQANREDRAQRSSTLLAHASGESVDAIDRHIDANNLSLGCQVLKRKRDTHK